jgi:hypothetical protein
MKAGASAVPRAPASAHAGKLDEEGSGRPLQAFEEDARQRTLVFSGGKRSEDGREAGRRNAAGYRNDVVAAGKPVMMGAVVARAVQIGVGNGGIVMAGSVKRQCIGISRQLVMPGVQLRLALKWQAMRKVCRGKTLKRQQDQQYRDQQTTEHGRWLVKYLRGV